MSCSAPGCSNRSDKDPKFAVQKQKVGKNVAAPASSACTFYDKTLMNRFMFVMKLLRRQLQIGTVGFEDQERGD